MSRAWYLMILVPLAIGASAVILSIMKLVDGVEQMQRVVMPGERTLALTAGDYIIYGETTSVVDGVSYLTESFSVSCKLTGAGGTPIALDRSSHTTYSIDGYRGRSLFEAKIDKDGRYTLACTGDKQAVLAFGHGMGATIVTIVLGALGGVFGAVGVLLIVLFRRRRFVRAADQPLEPRGVPLT